MYWKRWLTALVIIPPLLALILKGSQLLFTIVFIIITVLCLWEYFRIAFAGHDPIVSFAFKCWGYLAGAGVVGSAYHGDFKLMVMILSVCLIGTAASSILRFKITQDAPVVAVKQIFGVIYIAVFLSFIVLLRASPDGPYWVFFLMWVISWGDTGALYAGSTLGRHKLCPAVSPKKTVEGSVGGLAANLVFAWIFKLLFFSSMSGLTCTVLALSVGAVGQIGDLFESEFKRAAGVKDSGAILPGHGGLLDRLDALILAAPVAYILKEYLLP